MKRKLLNASLLKKTALAVPAAALMLGAAQAADDVTIGLNSPGLVLRFRRRPHKPSGSARATKPPASR